jgi:hypothetical protein
VAHQLPWRWRAGCWARPGSPAYARRRPQVPARSGPATSISDPDLLRLIRRVLVASPFAGEGYRKVRARLGREHGIRVSGNEFCGCSGARVVGPQRVRAAPAAAA